MDKYPRIRFLGISTSIIKLEWLSQGKASSLSNFETAARNKRYEALGKACQEEGITSLLLGHHADDQAETILLRLARGLPGLRGLRGMEHAAPIPGCAGLYGVHRSGSPHKMVGSDRIGAKHEAKHEIPVLDIESGGVRVYRPLLGFEKDRLVATCLESKTPWHEDATNQDQTLTLRNAIRYLLKNNQLPKALRTSYLTKFSEKVRKRIQVQESLANNWFQTCEIMAFDNRSGALVVRLPRYLWDPTNHAVSEQASARKEVIPAALNLVSRMVDLVTPEQEYNRSSLGTAVRNLFAETAEEDQPQVPGFTSCSVQFIRVYMPLKPSRNKFRQATKKASKTKFRDEVSRLDIDHVWILKRQNYNHGDCPQVVVPPTNTDHSDAAGSPLIEPAEVEWSPWQLWDGRFWIRIQNGIQRLVKVRPLQLGDMRKVAGLSPALFRDRVKNVLSLIAPGQLRYTLPIIVDDSGKLLGLPSLNMALEPRSVRSTVAWEIRYKHVDIGAGAPKSIRRAALPGLDWS